MAERKGTLDILSGILLLENEQLKDKTFVFAGKVQNSIREQFYSLMEPAKEKAHILVFDEFCSYRFLYDLCFTCDVIVIPYKDTNLSSGVIGYAALFEKPVIGPGSGLIGKIVKTNQMGITLENISDYAISKAFQENIVCGRNQYIESNKLNVFVDTIYS